MIAATATTTAGSSHLDILASPVALSRATHAAIIQQKAAGRSLGRRPRCRTGPASRQPNAIRLSSRLQLESASRPDSPLLAFSRHARLGAGEIAAGRLDVGDGLDFLKDLQRRPIGGNRFRQPLLVVLAHAKLAQRIAEVVLGPGPLDRHIRAGSDLE